MSFKFIIFLFIFTSCALFKGQPSLNSISKKDLLEGVKLTGEGRGRLSLQQNSYLFGFDSLMRDGDNWMLVVQIPLQGEEVMVLPRLKQKDAEETQMQSFEARIRNDFHKVNLNKVISSKEFLRELRSLVRFALSSDLGLNRECQRESDSFVCTQDDKNYIISTSKKKLLIGRELGAGRNLVLSAQNLTDSIFRQTNIHLYSSERNLNEGKSSFSLELFWK